MLAHQRADRAQLDDGAQLRGRLHVYVGEADDREQRVRDAAAHAARTAELGYHQRVVGAGVPGAQGEIARGADRDDRFQLARGPAAGDRFQPVLAQAERAAVIARVDRRQPHHAAAAALDPRHGIDRVGVDLRRRSG